MFSHIPDDCMNAGVVPSIYGTYNVVEGPVRYSSFIETGPKPPLLVPSLGVMVAVPQASGHRKNVHTACVSSMAVAGFLLFENDPHELPVGAGGYGGAGGGKGEGGSGGYGDGGGGAGGLGGKVQVSRLNTYISPG